MKKGFPAVFEDMSMMRNDQYQAFSSKYLRLNKRDQAIFDSWQGESFTFNQLKDKAGVYMIYNKVTKKFYIGMSNNLYKRLQNYLTEKRLIENSSSRINKALIKFGYQKFSVTILEFGPPKSYKSFKLKEREDFFIKIFKPQYNIRRPHLVMVANNKGPFSIPSSFIVPLKIQNLIEKCLDPSYLDWYLVEFSFIESSSRFIFVAVTPKYFVKADSSGWEQGEISKPCGYVSRKRKSKSTPALSFEFIKTSFDLINKEKLALFFPNQKKTFVADCLKKKIRALKPK